jgi:hypothetical protein
LSVRPYRHYCEHSANPDYIAPAHLNSVLTDPIYKVVNRQQRDEEFPWLEDLSDEQCLKIWQTYDRVYDLKGRTPGRDKLITTNDEAIEWACAFLDNIDAAGLEYFEDELERDEEYKLAAWMRKLRHECESVEEEHARYQRDTELVEELAIRRRCLIEQLAIRRRRLRPRN